MSGITGVYRFDGDPVPAETLRAMTEAIDHRGPDGAWTWRDGRVGLGHQRFETTPEAEHAGSPPERGDRVLTFDGRIDNREELLSALDVAGPQAPGRRPPPSQAAPRRPASRAVPRGCRCGRRR